MSLLLLDSCYYHSAVIVIGRNLLYIRTCPCTVAGINQSKFCYLSFLLLLFLMVTVINYIVFSDMLLLFLLIMRVINYMVRITLLLLLLLLMMLMMSMGPNFILNEFGRLVPSVG